jgi:hypothetical protein
MHRLNVAWVSALLLAASACSDDSTNSLGSVNGDAGAGNSSGPASGGSAEAGGAAIDDETGGSAGSGMGGDVGAGGTETGGTGAGGDPGIGGGGFSASGGDWLSTGGNGVGGEVGTGGDAGSAGTRTGGDQGSGGDGVGGNVATGGDAGSAGNGSGGDPGTGGTGTGGQGGGGGAGGVDCPMLPSCNWCGGENVMDANGCVTGWVCANGIDPCEDSSGGCADVAECQTDKVCEDNLCWPDPDQWMNLFDFEWVPNPCTTDPCLPGMVGGIVEAGTGVTHIIVDDRGWVTEGVWDGFDGFTPLPGQPVMVRGRVVYHTNINGQVYTEIELTGLTARVG